MATCPRWVLALGILATMGLAMIGPAAVLAEPQYLAFQVFTSGALPGIPPGGDGPQPLSSPPTKAVLEDFVRGIVQRVGTTGDARHRLAFVIGPLALDHTDADLQRVIADAFQVALDLDVAVGFHVDDSMFWARRTDLWHDPDNLEWIGWEGIPSTGRRIDWSAQPTELAPQMCYNSPGIQAEVDRVSSQVLGAAIAQGISALNGRGRPELFAGVFVGWETQLGQDFDTGRYTGYHALSNLGYSRQNLPADADVEREKVVQEFIRRWARGVGSAGVPSSKIYSHTAVFSKPLYDSKQTVTSYAQISHFAPPEVSFGLGFQPGFSTYPQPGLMQQLYGELAQHGSPAWASAEGSVVDPATQQPVVGTEAYLAGMFNHGAALVNLFGWGVGADDNPFRKAAESPEAIAAYRKFLAGGSLEESR